MERRNGATMARKTAAMNTLTRLRAEGVPSVVTADEAFRMTGGQAGTRGDHSTPVTLAHLVTTCTTVRHLRDIEVGA